MYRTASGNSHIFRHLKPSLVDTDSLRDPGDEGEGGDDGGEGEGGDDGSGDGTGGADTDDQSIKNPELKKLHDEAARHRNEAKAERAERLKVEAKLKEYEDKDKTELEKLQSENTELKERLALAESELATVRLDNAFVLSGAASLFKDSSDGWIILQRKNTFEPDEDGQFDGAAIKKAAEALLKEKPHLAADGGDGPGTTPTGGSPSNGRRTQTNEKKKEELLKKFPALRR